MRPSSARSERNITKQCIKAGIDIHYLPALPPISLADTKVVDDSPTMTCLRNMNCLHSPSRRSYRVGNYRSRLLPDTASTGAAGRWRASTCCPSLLARAPLSVLFRYASSQTEMNYVCHLSCSNSRDNGAPEHDMLLMV